MNLCNPLLVLLALGFAAAAPGLSAQTQPAGALPRIGVLTDNFPPPREDLCLDGLRQGLRDNGLVEGKSIALEPRWGELGAKRMQDLAADLVRRKVEIIVAGSNSAAVALRAATSTIPVIMGPISDAVEQGLVASLARPGGNFTGFSYPGSGYNEKRLEFAREIAGAGAKIAVLMDAGQTRRREPLEASIRRLGIAVAFSDIRQGEDFRAAFESAARSGAKVVVLSQGPIFARQRKTIGELALKHRLPVVTGDVGIEESGILVYYGTPPPDLCRAAAKHVSLILKGAKPANLPVEQPTKITMVVNLKTAKALGLKIPQAILLRADRVIE